MRSRSVPVLRLGSRGPGGDARSLRLCSQASAIVRNRPQSSAIVRKRSRSVGLCRRDEKSSRNAELSSLFTFRITKVSTVTGIGGGRGRETQKLGRHFWPCLWREEWREDERRKER